MNPHDRRLPSPVLVLPLLLLLAGCGNDDGGAAARADGARIPEPSFPTVSDSLLRSPGTAWAVHGGNLSNHRFSPLDQIGPETVHELVPAWIYSTGLEGALATTPIVVGNTLYATTAQGRVVALNAATGAELWTFRPELGPVTLCCGPINRGVSAYNDKVYVASLDAGLLALDARTGERAWEADLAEPADGYSATMAPLAVDGRVFVGVEGERYGSRGFLAAFDAGSGEELWRWHTIPGEEEGGWWGEWTETDPFGTPLNRDIEAERSDSTTTSWSWRVGGGGIATTPAYDPETGRLFVNVEGPAPLAGGSSRPGDNLFTGSIVALDAATGERVWATQYLPHDAWGLSGGSPPILFDRGDERYVAFAGRTGWVYVFAANDGRPILRSDNFVPQEGLFRRPAQPGQTEGPRGVRVAPGANGGNPGAGIAYHAGSGLAYVGGVHQPMVYAEDPEPYRQGQLWLGGTVRLAPEAEAWGTVTAIDLGSGEIQWQKRTPAPVHSDVLGAGGLVFVGQGRGTIDAFDARSGELLWQFETGGGVHGGPVTYEVAGVQYIAVPAGGSYHFDTPAGDDLIAFALASRVPGRAVDDYPATDYERSGPATPGTAEVRQVRDTAAAGDTARSGRPTGPDGSRGSPRGPGAGAVDSQGPRR